MFDAANPERLVKSMSDNSYTLDNYGDRGERKIHSVTTLQFESVRLATFYYFRNEKNKADINDLVKKGFYYNRLFDCVYCTFCGSKIPQDHNYRAAALHKNNPSCPTSISPLNGNVPLVDPDATDPLSKINRMLQEFMMFKVKYAAPGEKDDLIFHDKGIMMDRNRNFADYRLRLSTYTYWFLYLPQNLRPKKELYAEAGFVCTGFTDIVQCFHCKGGLFNVDISDDPVQEHAKLYGHCTFIRSYCSRHNIEIKGDQITVSEAMFTEDEQNLLMEHPLIQNLISRGYDRSIIKKKMVDFVYIRGSFPYAIETCIADIENTTM